MSKGRPVNTDSSALRARHLVGAVGGAPLAGRTVKDRKQPRLYAHFQAAPDHRAAELLDQTLSRPGSHLELTNPRTACKRGRGAQAVYLRWERPNGELATAVVRHRNPALQERRAWD